MMYSIMCINAKLQELSGMSSSEVVSLVVRTWFSSRGAIFLNIKTDQHVQVFSWSQHTDQWAHSVCTYITLRNVFYFLTVRDSLVLFLRSLDPDPPKLQIRVGNVGDR